MNGEFALFADHLLARYLLRFTSTVESPDAPY